MTDHKDPPETITDVVEKLWQDVLDVVESLVNPTPQPVPVPIPIRSPNRQDRRRR